VKARHDPAADRLGRRLQTEMHVPLHVGDDVPHRLFEQFPGRLRTAPRSPLLAIFVANLFVFQDRWRDEGADRAVALVYGPGESAWRQQLSCIKAIFVLSQMGGGLPFGEHQMTKADGYTWEFKARFRRHAYGWKSHPAIQRVKQAVKEIKKVARKDPVLAADGAVTLLERLSPALENVDSSSGAIGTTVNNAVAELVPIIAGAPAGPETREGWLERLWEAHAADQVPYIESLADFWGELCASQEAAATWADRLVDITRMALSPDKDLRSHFHGTSACLSALFRAERYGEIVDILQVDTIWTYRRWAVKALAAMGRKREAIRYAESSRGPWTPDGEVDAICEEILLSSGSIEEAYEQYGLRASRGGTYLATFRAVAKKYPHRSAGQIPAERQPAFAVNAGLLALHWLVKGYGYDITGADVWAAYSITMKAAEKNGTIMETREKVKALLASEGPGGFVAEIIGRELGL
jgi:NAD(P)-dependent dehydrogenase (short-subunit alcohol dehydrogenase family)